MADYLSCYGPELKPLSDSIDAFNPFDKAEWRSFFVQRWRLFADVIGFRSEFEPLASAAIKADEQLGSLQNLVPEALQNWIDKRGIGKTGYPYDKIATLRTEAMKAWRGDYPTLWTLSLNGSELPGGGCYQSFRAFPLSTAPNYFADSTSDAPVARDVCDWSTPLVLSPALWPWISGANLRAPPPGLRWISTPTARPAVEAARILQRAWTVEGNAATDAREVYKSWQIFRATTAPVVAKVQSKPSGPGSLFITAEGTIQAHLVAAQNQHLIGPLGPLSVRAFNHCVRCFAGFWALRRAIVDNATAMPAKIKLALEATSDPCVAKFVTGKAIGEISNG